MKFELGYEDPHSGIIKMVISLRSRELKSAKREVQDYLNKWDAEFDSWDYETEDEFISKVIPGMGEGFEVIVLADDGTRYLVTGDNEWELYESTNSETITIEEEFKVPGTDIVLEKGDVIQIKKEGLLRDIDMIQSNILSLSQKYDPKTLARILVSGIMDGIAESEYGSDDRFLVALRKELLEYGV